MSHRRERGARVEAGCPLQDDPHRVHNRAGIRGQQRAGRLQALGDERIVVDQAGGLAERREIQLDALAAQRLQIGDAEFEVSMVCDPCELMEEIRPGLQAELEGKRGMLAKVLTTGRVSQGDRIELL